MHLSGISWVTLETFHTDGFLFPSMLKIKSRASQNFKVIDHASVECHKLNSINVATIFDKLKRKR